MDWSESQTRRIEPVRPEADLAHRIKLQWLFHLRLPATVSRWWGVRHYECLVIVQWSAVPRTFAHKNIKTRGRGKKMGWVCVWGGPVSKKVIHSFQPSGPALMGLGRTRCCSVCWKYREKEHVMEQLNRCNKISLPSEVVNLRAYDVHLTCTSIEEAETEKHHWIVFQQSKT